MSKSLSQGSWSTLDLYTSIMGYVCMLKFRMVSFSCYSTNSRLLPFNFRCKACRGGGREFLSPPAPTSVLAWPCTSEAQEWASWAFLPPPQCWATTASYSAHYIESNWVSCSSSHSSHEETKLLYWWSISSMKTLPDLLTEAANLCSVSIQNPGLHHLS